MEKIPVFDAHCDTLWHCRSDGGHLARNHRNVDLARTDGFSQYAQVFAVFFNSAEPLPHGNFLEVQEVYDLFRRELADCSDFAAFCRGRAAVEQAIQDGKAAALLSIEGGELIDCDPDHLETVADWGVQFINLTWNHPNRLSGTNCREQERGLGDLGKAFVREAQRLGIRLDVSHVSERGFWDLCALSDQPIVASHSNAKALCDHPRNLTDDQARAIAQLGGVIGLNFYRDFIGGSGDIPMLIRHLEHLLSLCGEDAVGLGADWDGCDRLCGGLSGIQDLPQLYAALKQLGYGTELLRKLFFENWMRVIRP